MEAGHLDCCRFDPLIQKSCVNPDVGWVGEIDTLEPIVDHKRLAVAGSNSKMLPAQYSARSSACFGRMLHK